MLDLRNSCMKQINIFLVDSSSWPYMVNGAEIMSFHAKCFDANCWRSWVFRMPTVECSLLIVFLRVCFVRNILHFILFYGLFDMIFNWIPFQPFWVNVQYSSNAFFVWSLAHILGWFHISWPKCKNRANETFIKQVKVLCRDVQQLRMTADFLQVMSFKNFLHFYKFHHQFLMR